MKKKLLFLFLLTLVCLVRPTRSFAQSVAINADSSAADPSAILDLKSTTKGFLAPRMTLAQRNIIAAPAVGLLIYQTDNTPGFYAYDGAAWSAVKASGGGGGGGSDSFWSDSANTINSTNTGSVLIKTNLGIGGAPAALSNKLQIGDVGLAGYNGNDIAIGNGANQAFGLGVQPDKTVFGSTGNMVFLPATTYVGINTASPINRLQIGDVGSTGFMGNDFAVGNGTGATAFNQYNTLFQVASTGDIAFLPQANLGGRIGINTTAPRAALDVVGSYTITPLNDGYSYLNWFSAGSVVKGVGDASTPVKDISLIASNNIYANAFYAYSDIRIKNLIGTSNAKQDFQTINKIAIRDYTMKDKLKYGDHHFKKVIAQELEKVDPDLVTKHPDFIPNVYQLTDRITKTSSGYLLHFAQPHHLGDTAKKLQVLIANPGSLQSFDILSIPSPKEIVINAPEIMTDMIFVYGEEVPNFRTVDYEGLTTLNISATQELSKEVNQLQHDLAEARADMRLMAKEIHDLKHRAANNHLTSIKRTTHQSPATQSKKI